MKNNSVFSSIIMATAMIAGGQIMAADGVTIDRLSPSNSFVQPEGEGRYLLLPVEEAMDDATVNVLVDGNLTETFYVRLARNTTDFYVPFDLSRLPEGKVVFDVRLPEKSVKSHDGGSEACWEGFQLSDTFDTANREKYRPAYHHTPLYGWMNDPNGMFYKDGLWHLYYQYNPYGSKWQNMTWGHSTSKDLVSWEHREPAIWPDGLGSIFSGSAVVDHANTAGFGEDAVVALYTSASANQMQSMAHSNDNGQTFVKYPGNPILTLDSEARDPNMFWNEATGEWNLLLAHALDHEMLIFTSPDLKTWTLQSAFGKGLGAQNGVWECPDLLQLPVAGTDKKKWVLICNLNPGGPFGGSATQYFVGDFDGKTFTADTLSDGSVPTKWMDHGKDHYATVSWSNAPENRHVVVGWMSNWQYANEVPTTQFRSANTLPRDISLFEAGDGQYYLLTNPSPEMEKLRGALDTKVRNKKLSDKGTSYRLPAANDGVCEIVFKGETSKEGVLELILSNAKGEHTNLIYDSSSQTVKVDRRESGLTEFSVDFPAVTEAPVLDNDTEIGLRMYLDRSSLEVFDTEGRFVLTNLVFPTEPYTTLTVKTLKGRGKLNTLQIYSIK